MAKNDCPSCGELKDTRAKQCKACRWVHNPMSKPNRGWAIKSSGYVRGFFGGKALYQHREIMSFYLGRPLLRNEVVHHMDHDRGNNTIDNLELMNQSKHARLHIMGRAEDMSRKGHEARWNYVV
jgi:hypothetical protein